MSKIQKLENLEVIVELEKPVVTSMELREKNYITPKDIYSADNNDCYCHGCYSNCNP